MRTSRLLAGQGNAAGKKAYYRNNGNHPAALERCGVLGTICKDSQRKATMQEPHRYVEHFVVWQAAANNRGDDDGRVRENHGHDKAQENGVHRGILDKAGGLAIDQPQVPAEREPGVAGQHACRRIARQSL